MGADIYSECKRLQKETAITVKEIHKRLEERGIRTSYSWLCEYFKGTYTRSSSHVMKACLEILIEEADRQSELLARAKRAGIEG